jgi:hypothetical protein
MNLPALLIRLYPAAWRARYGEEFAALLEEHPVGPFDVADIVLGALDARLRLRSRSVNSPSAGGATTMSLRIGGFAAIIGAVLMAAALVVGSGLVGVTVEPVLGLVVMVVGALVLLVALAGLSAFQARSNPRLAWAAFAVPALGAIGMIVGIAGMGIEDGPFWYVWFAGLLAFFVGSALFAMATFRTGLLSRTAATLLGGGAVLAFVAAAMPAVGFAPERQTGVLGVALVGFVLGWAALGFDAVRIDRHDLAPRPV